MAKKIEPQESATVENIAKSLRELRFGAAGAKAKNTSLPRMARKERARVLHAQTASKRALAISSK